MVVVPSVPPTPLYTVQHPTRYHEGGAFLRLDHRMAVPVALSGRTGSAKNAD
jgi:hypothetical protein